MRIISSCALAVMVSATVVGCAGASSAGLGAYPPIPHGHPPGASATARATARALAPGINFGNMLEAPREGDYGLTVRPEYLEQARVFRSVRLPVRWSNHAAVKPPFAIDTAFMEHVDSIVTALLDRGQYVVLNMENYSQLDGDALEPGEVRVPGKYVRLRYIALWQQIAERFRGHSDHLLFELYVHPHGLLLPGAWKDLSYRALAAVRRSNPERVVLLPVPAVWPLPNDPNLIFSVDLSLRAWSPPVNWVRRGYAPPSAYSGFPALPLQALSWADAWSRSHGYPVFVAGFGEDYEMAPYVRARAAGIIREAIERYGMGWAYWDLGSTFGLHDPGRERYAPEMLRALLRTH